MLGSQTKLAGTCLPGKQRFFFGFTTTAFATPDHLIHLESFSEFLTHEGMMAASAVIVHPNEHSFLSRTLR